MADVSSKKLNAAGVAPSNLITSAGQATSHDRSEQNAQAGYGFSHHGRRFGGRVRWRLAGLELTIGSNLLLLDEGAIYGGRPTLCFLLEEASFLVA
jgi:hypothetical protein